MQAKLHFPGQTPQHSHLLLRTRSFGRFFRVLIVVASAGTALAILNIAPTAALASKSALLVEQPCALVESPTIAPFRVLGNPLQRFMQSGAFCTTVFYSLLPVRRQAASSTKLALCR